jgi:hypothetical protein
MKDFLVAFLDTGCLAVASDDANTFFYGIQTVESLGQTDQLPSFSSVKDVLEYWRTRSPEDSDFLTVQCFVKFDINLEQFDELNEMAFMYHQDKFIQTKWKM